MYLIDRAQRFLDHDLWTIRTADLPRFRRWPLKLFKLTVLSIRGFQADNGSMRASALTLYTLLSIVPVLALVFGIAKGFGLETRFEIWVVSQLPNQEDLAGRAVAFARSALQTAEGGVIAGAGVIFLLYAVIKVIGNIEEALNHIWAVVKPRSWGRRFSDYLSLILVGPFLVLAASSLNLYLGAWVSRAAESAPLSGIVGPLARLGLEAVPWLMLWLLFSFTYTFLPNTKVRVVSGLIGGALAALLYQLLQSIYIELQVGVSRNNAIYGSFAALPLFIIWLQLSWQVFLMGAEFTQHHQHFESNELEERVPDLSFRSIKRIGLAVSTEVLGRFTRGEPAPSAEEIGTALGIPSRVLAGVLRRLVDARILVETSGEPADIDRFVPARDPSLLTPVAIISGLECTGEDIKEGTEAATLRAGELMAEVDSCLERSEVLTKAGAPS